MKQEATGKEQTPQKCVSVLVSHVCSSLPHTKVTGARAGRPHCALPACPWRPVLTNSGGALTVQPTDRTDSPHSVVPTGAVHVPSSGLCHPPVAANRTSAFHAPSDFHRQRCRRGVHIGPQTGHMSPAHTHHHFACESTASTSVGSWGFRPCRHQAQDQVIIFRPRDAEKRESSVRRAFEPVLCARGQCCPHCPYAVENRSRTYRTSDVQRLVAHGRLYKVVAHGWGY